MKEKETERKNKRKQQRCKKKIVKMKKKKGNVLGAAKWLEVGWNVEIVGNGGTLTVKE